MALIIPMKNDTMVDKVKDVEASIGPLAGSNKAKAPLLDLLAVVKQLSDRLRALEAKG